jgi:ammonia channel protein AmtB
VFTFFGSLLLLEIVDLALPLRVRPDQEECELDLSQHGENIE